MGKTETWMGQAFTETLLDGDLPEIACVYVVVKLIEQPPGYTRAQAYQPLYVGHTDNLRAHLPHQIDSLDPTATALHWRALSDPASRAALAAELIRALAPPMNTPE